MKKKTTKLLTALFTLCIVLTLMPMTAFADPETYAVKFYPGDHGTMTKNDQIPFVYYGIDDDVNKPYYYKLNVSETETLSFASSIISVLSPSPGYELPTGLPMLPSTKSAAILPFLLATLFPPIKYRAKLP